MRVKTGQFHCQHNIAREFYKQRAASESIIPVIVFHRVGSESRLMDYLG